MVELVQEHTEHIGHEPEDNLHPTDECELLFVDDIIEEPPEHVIEAPRMLPKVRVGSCADAFPNGGKVGAVCRSRTPRLSQSSIAATISGGVIPAA